GDVSMHLHNSFHWGARQYAALSTTNIPSFTTNDFRKGFMKHWLVTRSNAVGQTISMQRGPSPDSGGTIEGQKTWYDYSNKFNLNNAYEGSQVEPLFVGLV